MTVEVPPSVTSLPRSSTPPPSIDTSCGTGESFFMSMVTGPACASSEDLSNFSWPDGSAASASFSPAAGGVVSAAGSAASASSSASLSASRTPSMMAVLMVEITSAIDMPATIEA